MRHFRHFAAPGAAAILFALPLGACAQSSELPSAPDASTKPVFRLPPSTPVTVAAPTSAAPSPPYEETDDCYAAAEGLYAKQKPLPPAVQREVDRYTFLMMHKIREEWDRHMPLAAKYAWLKGEILAVRFAIMPDGSIDPPMITMHSGRESFDKHAVDAINASAPYAPLPDGVDHPLAMCFRFTYNLNLAPKKAAPIDLWPPPAKPVKPKPSDAEPK